MALLQMITIGVIVYFVAQFIRDTIKSETKKELDRRQEEENNEKGLWD